MLINFWYIHRILIKMLVLIIFIAGFHDVETAMQLQDCV